MRIPIQGVIFLFVKQKNYLWTNYGSGSRSIYSELKCVFNVNLGGIRTPAPRTEQSLPLGLLQLQPVAGYPFGEYRQFDHLRRGGFSGGKPRSHFRRPCRLGHLLLALVNGIAELDGADDLLVGDERCVAGEDPRVH